MKLKTVYVCENCGLNSQKWLGKCPDCEAWNSFQEDIVEKDPQRKHKGIKIESTPLSSEQNPEERLITGINELDRVLGGGIIEGSMMLLSGEPGIGKSTLTLSICEKVAALGKNTLYVSGEESPSQIGLRARRMGINNQNINILGETNLENILATIGSNASKDKLNPVHTPDFIVIDSIQVISSSEIPSIAGSINQVRYCTESLMHFAKKNRIPVLIIGHVTKDGNLAGPKILEHLVDTVLLIEGDRYQNLRILRGIKNRFGSTNEIGLFEMAEKGLMEVKDASKLFLEGRKEGAHGSAITATVEGTRPLLMEVQALTNTTPFGYPKRAASGFDLNRLQLLLAVIQKHLGINVANQDVYVNVVGGYKLSDPAADLAVVMAIISSLKKIPLPSDAVYIGEIGLSGELRNISNLEKRVKEAQKIGFKQIVTPSLKSSKMENVNPIKDIAEALKTIT